MRPARSAGLPVRAVQPRRGLPRQLDSRRKDHGLIPRAPRSISRRSADPFSRRLRLNHVACHPAQPRPSNGWGFFHELIQARRLWSIAIERPSLTTIGPWRGGPPAGAQINRFDIKESGAKGENQQIPCTSSVLLIPETKLLADLWILMNESLDLFRTENVFVFGEISSSSP